MKGMFTITLYKVQVKPRMMFNFRFACTESVYNITMVKTEFWNVVIATSQIQDGGENQDGVQNQEVLFKIKRQIRKLCSLQISDLFSG